MLERFPMSIPYGWFFVAYSDELAVGDVRPVHYFGRDQVLFRTETGEAGMLDAYCPHLGAHMGQRILLPSTVPPCPMCAPRCGQ